MPRDQLRSSGALQAMIVAIVLGLVLRGTPASTAASTWPYGVAAYGFLAATVPWLAGGLSRSELSLGYSAMLGLMLALPMCLSSVWLWPTPYRTISLAFCALAALWALHFLVALVIWWQGRRP